MREEICLDGVWDFAPDPDRRGWPSPRSLPGGIAESRRIRVPGCWQAQFEDLRDYEGVAWYGRVFEVPAGWKDRLVRVEFGAVDYSCDVWVNGEHVGSHEGGYDPFSLDIGRVLRAGQRISILVRVLEPTDDPAVEGDSVFSQVPHGKQGWYGRVGGIWQPVWCVATARRHLDDVRVTADPWGRRVGVWVGLAGSEPAEVAEVAEVADAVEVEITGPDGRPVAFSRTRAPEGSEGLSVEVSVPEARYWTCEDPALYRARIRLVSRDAEPIDEVSRTFGFRTVEAHGGELRLNGRPTYLTGALDQDYYPLTAYTPPSVEFLEDQFRKAKQLGLNLLRCHVKVPDPRYLDAADRVGLLVWEELPSWGRLTEASAARARRTLDAMVRRDWSHPCVIIRSVVNESWGLDLANDASHRRWLRDTVRWLRQADPTRLVVDNSPCFPNFHVDTDIEDFHSYKSVPDHVEAWDEWVEEFSRRPCWTFSPHGDSARRGDEPLVVSEFGVWGLPHLGPLTACCDGRNPWWHMRSATWDWAGAAAAPHGVRERFASHSLGHVFGSYDEVVRQSQWHQFVALKYQIESLRLKPTIAGYVVTELTDTYWECNGLLDMFRNPKVFHGLLRSINAEDAIIPRVSRCNFRSGEDVRVGIWLRSSGALGGRRLRLVWYLDRCGALAAAAGDPAGSGSASASASASVSGSQPVPEVPGRGVFSLGTVAFIAPEVAAPARYRLRLRLELEDEAGTAGTAGVPIAGNFQDLQVFPGARVQPCRATGQGDLRVAVKVDGELLSHLDAGGQALIVAEDEEAVPPELAAKGWPRLRRRAGTPWEGDWISNLNWIRVDAGLEALRGVGPGIPAPVPVAGESQAEAEFDRHGFTMDFAFRSVIPDLVIDGVKPEQFPDVLAGTFVGWLQNHVAYAYQFRFGRGRAVLTTLRLRPGTADPMPETILDGWVAYLASERCQPKTTLYA